MSRYYVATWKPGVASNYPYRDATHVEAANVHEAYQAAQRIFLSWIQTRSNHPNGN